MIKVGKILGIMEIFGGFFLIFLLLWIFFVGGVGAARSTRILEEMVGTGAWLGLALASFSECSEVL